MSRFFWMPSADSTIVYVKEVYDGWIIKNKIRTIAHFYSSGRAPGWDYEGAVVQAKNLIRRLEAK